MRIKYLNENNLRYKHITYKMSVFTFLILILYVMLKVSELTIKNSGVDLNIGLFGVVADFINRIALALLLLGVASLLLAIILYFVLPETYKIKVAIRGRLYSARNGNPLKLKVGDTLPKIKCKKIKDDKYQLDIFTETKTSEEISNLRGIISSSLRKGKLKNYVVRSDEESLNSIYVRFYIQDISIDNSIKYETTNEMKQKNNILLTIRKDQFIDLSVSNGGILLVGETRSGKLYGCCNLLIQLLLNSRDKYESEIMIIDPKGSDFTILPRTIYPDVEIGNFKQAIDALKKFNMTRISRQAKINEVTNECGRSVQWHDLNMKPSVLFIDEYIALRNMLPKTNKNDPEYCVTYFDDLLKTIITQGSSAGCFVIISVEQASVGEGGLSSVILEAMKTKILFMPTRNSAKFLWDSAEIESLPNKKYVRGEAWFSSKDGTDHSVPTYVKFPELPERYLEEMKKLIESYYGNCTSEAESVA